MKSTTALCAMTLTVVGLLVLSAIGIALARAIAHRNGLSHDDHSLPALAIAVLVGVVAVLLCSTAARPVVAVGPAWERRSGLARGPVVALAESL